jgi:hypothetical protein
MPQWNRAETLPYLAALSRFMQKTPAFSHDRVGNDGDPSRNGITKRARVK